MRVRAWKPSLFPAFAFLLCLAAQIPAKAQGWSNGYSYRRSVTIFHSQVPNTDQTNFPMLFSGTYAYLATTANGGGVTSSSGYDIIFTSDSAGTNVLPYERESYNGTTGAVIFWVQVPTVSHTSDTVVYLFYGDSSVTTDQSNKTGTWDSNFKGVWHMGNGTTLSAADSTSNGNNGTVGGSPTAITGQIGGGVNFSGSSDRFAISSISVSSVSYTISGWLNAPIPSNSAGWNTLTRGANDHEVLIRESDWQLGEYDNAGGTGFHGCGYYVNVLSQGWHYLVAVGTGSVTNFYIDGAYTCQSNKKSNDSVVSLGNYQGGTQPFGKTDEIRISTGVARSADWITTEFNNLSSPITFYDEGSTSITGLSPTSGYYATSVTVTGRHFGSSQGSSTITFNGITATPTSWNDTSIVVPVPFGVSSGNVVVTVSSAASNGRNFSIFPTGWSDSDVGTVGIAGSASYGSDKFTVNGSGAAIWGTADGFNFAYQSLSGDGTILARLVSLTGGASGQSAGLMIRETLTAGSRNYYVNYLPPSNGAFGWSDRTTTNGSSSGQTITGNTSAPYWVKVVRSGNSFSGYASADGVDWTQLGSTQTITMATNVYIGLAVTGAGTSSIATAIFDNVSVTQSSSSPPVVSSISETSGSVGSQVVILGSNFGSTRSNSGVTLNGAPATINSWSATVIDVTIPSGASTGYLVVSTAPSMDSNPVFFTVTNQALPSGWFDTDIGTVGITGSAGYASGTFTVSGAGSGLGGTADAFHFVYQPLSAAGTIVARVSSFSASTNSGSAGVMIRETLTAGSTETSTNFANSGSGSYYGYLNYRTSTNGSGSGQQGSAPQAFVPYWLKITRSGSTLSGYTSTDGVTWTQTVSTKTISMATNVYIGLAVTSGSTASLATAAFDQVSTYNGGEISGTITKTSDGTALSGAVIQARQLGTVIGTATSDSSGKYGIYLAGGSYDMQVSASGYGTTVTNAVLVPVDSVTTFNASLSSPGSVSGTITQSNGVTAIQGAVVQALVGDASVASATSASNGSYTISGLNAGTYQIQATATGYVSAGQSASVTAGGNATANISLQTQSSGAVSYVYDPLGRLVGVINPGGNTAIYNYDAVGNVLSISTQSSSSLSIISFAPASGTFGTTVTLYGTGFNTTPNQNTVKFNGLAGTVTSASPTQLIVAVPIGATTGTISVTTSAGTVTSVSSFTVNP